LGEIDNSAVAEFFRAEIAAKRENNLRYRRLQWRFRGKRRFRVGARRNYAIVKQFGRFEDDKKFWTDTMGADIQLRDLGRGENLRFLLQTKEQLQKLPAAIQTLQNTTFIEVSGSAEGADAEADE
jgi:hypothetical protein